MGRSQMITHVARERFLQKHRAEMVDFLEDYIHVLHYLSDRAHHQQAADVVAEATKQNPSLFESWIFTNKDYYAILTPCPTSIRCRPMSICNTSSASCARRSTSRNTLTSAS